MNRQEDKAEKDNIKYVSFEGSRLIQFDASEDENMIDWENAPDGATHYSPEDEDKYQAWWKIDGDGMLYIFNNGISPFWTKICVDKTVELIPRPTPQPYIPKVGEEIEYKEDPLLEVYTPAIYCGYVDSDYIVKHHKESPTILTRFHNKPERMRPIKTESEKQADKMYELVKDAVDLYAACEILVENGYKK